MPIDSDAQAYLTAIGVPNDGTVYYSGTAYQLTGAQITTIVDRLFTDLKGASLYTKLKALYPFVGGTAAAHKFNALNPVDTDGGFRLTFSGGWTHSGAGALPDGSSGYANSHFAPSTQTTLNSEHLSAYLNTNNSPTSADPVTLGALNSTTVASTLVVLGTSLNSRLNGDNITATTTTRQGHSLSTKTSSSLTTLYRDGASIGSGNSGGSLSTSSIFIGSLSISGSVYTDGYTKNQFAFVSFGDGLSDSEASAFYTIIQRFQTSLNRYVGTGVGTGDTTAPTAAFGSPTPSASATVTGTQTFAGTCSDDIAVTSIQPKIDGTNWGSAITGSSLTTFSKALDTTTLTNGSHTISFVFSDAAGNTTTISRTVTVDNAAISTTSPLPSGTVGSAYSQSILASGGITPYNSTTPATVSTGTLPAGVTFTSSDGTSSTDVGTLAGTPTTAGTYNFTVLGHDDDGTAFSKAFTLVISASGGGAVTPVASFTKSPTSGVTTATSVSFTDTSTNTPTSWTWNFGDGNTSTAQNPNHTYSTPGTYTVSHTASNSAGTGTASTQTVTVSVVSTPPSGTAIEFDEVEINRQYAAEAKGGPMFSTSILTSLNSGMQQRNSNRDFPIHVFEFQFEGEREETDFAELLAFFMTRRGAAIGFRFFPFFDNSWDDELIFTGDGVTTEVPLIRTYTIGGRTLVRRIVKPVETITVTKNGAAVDHTVDYTTGIITFAAAPAVDALIRVTGEYCIPVVFNTDKVDISGFASYLDLQGLSVIEIPPAALGIE